MSRALLLLLIIVVSTSGCVTTSHDLNDYTIDDKLVGKWGTSKEACLSKPDELIFSADGKQLEILLGEPRTSKDGETYDKLSYKILEFSERYVKVLHGDMPANSLEGKRSTYHLRLLSENRQCMSFGLERACTSTNQRCI